MSTERTREVGGGPNCQIQSIAQIGTRIIPNDLESLSFKKTLRLAIKRRLSLQSRKKLRIFLFNLKRLFIKDHKMDPIATPVSVPVVLNLQAGDRVRVRTKEEIQATFDSWSEFKGCAFLDEMWQYCGSTQTVHKRVERFVDERDYRIKKVKGVVLLDGVTCSGTAFYGKCDRSCLYFWREEWLERIGG